MHALGDISRHSVEQRETHSLRDSCSILENTVLPNFLKNEENQTTSRAIKDWRIAQGTLQLFAASHQPLSAQLTTDLKMISIRSESIIGIPVSVQRNPSQLEAYLKDTYARLVPVGQGKYHIQVFHGLKGGMDEEEMSSRSFKRQMSSSSSSSASISSQSVEAPSSSDFLPFGSELPPELLNKLKRAVEQAKQAQDRDIIAFVGVTGSGKSTAINHLLGCEMEEKEVNGSVVIEAKDPLAALTKIGHQAALSETEFTLLCQRPDFPYVFADCGGFLDRGGEIAEILTSISMKLTLENAKSVKVVLCIPYNSLIEQRAIGSTEALRALDRLLSDIDACKNSVGILLTRPPIIGTRSKQRLAAVEDAKRTIVRIMSELEEHVQELQYRNSPDVVSIGLQLGLYQFLLRDGGRYLAVYDPLDNDSRSNALGLFDQMESIEEPKGKFRTTLSDRTALHLSEQIIGMAGRACPLYEALLRHRYHIRDTKAEIARLTEQMQSVNRLFDKIRNETNDPEQIEAQHNAMREEQMNLLEIKLTGARVEEESLQQQMEIQKTDFQFACDYLELSGDTKLLANGVIKHFLKLTREIYEN